MKTQNLLMLLSLTVASLSTSAQACFNSSNDYVFQGPSSSRCITKADYDNDGDLDVVLGNYTGFNDPVLDRLYLIENNGDATFNAPVSISSGSRPIDVISSDFDNDGDMDLAVVNFENSFSEIGILIGNGDGTFQAPVRYDTEFGPNNISLGDFNGDGHEDLAVTTNGSTVNVLLANNAVPGTFLAYTSLTLTTGTNPQDVATGDFNGDTFIDIVTANKGTGNVSVFNGDGSGGFAADVAHATDSDCNGVIAADLDGDTNLDIISANETGNNISVLINDGAGSFVAAVNYATENGPLRLEQDDVNNDGDIDIITVNGSSNTISVFNGNGDGTLQAQNSAAAIGSPTNLVTGDFDGDSNIDVILSCLIGQVMPVFLGDGTGIFKIGDFTGVGAGPDALFADDINGDGDNDFVVINETDGNATIHYGAGDGTFILGQTLITGAGPSDVSGADLNGNGFTDIIVTNYTDGNISVFLNTAGVLGAGTTYSCNVTPIALDTGDVNNDGDYDVVVLNENDQVSVLIGNGTGGFGAPTTYATGSSPLGLDLGDANNDNVPDLVVANSAGNNVSYFVNNGTGVFLAPATINVGTTPKNVQFGDISGDGVPEIVTANFGSNNISVVLNNGSGTFAPFSTNYSSGDTGPQDLSVKDFDNDGDNDVVAIFQVSVASTGYAVLFDNDGAGAIPFSQRFSTGMNPQNIVSSDFNGDGNCDLAISNFDNDNVSIMLSSAATISALGPTTFCGGDSVDLQAGAADNYNWSTTETTQTITVNASGSYSVTTSSQSGWCSSTSPSITVTVSGGPTLSASGTTTICDGQSTTITISGADTYSWDSGLGTGPTKTVSPTSNQTYNVTGEETATGCQTTLPVSITVNPLPDATFSGLNADYCEDAATSTLVPTTGGGSFSGSGVSGTTFDPTTSGTGTISVTYNITDGNGCSDNTSQNTTVNALPDATFSGLNADYCEDASSSTLVPTTGGGSFSGSGVSGTTFDPTTSGTGTISVTYTITDGNGCSDNTSQNTTVNALPDATFSGLNADYCEDAATSTLVPATGGGSFSGSGVSGTTFDPTASGTGTITVTYNITDGNGCSDNSSQNTTVNALPDASFTTLDADYCSDAAIVDLNPTTTGGTFTGSGVTGTDFDPGSATVGTVNITYNITDGNGCSNSSNQSTVVNQIPVGSFTGLDPNYCENDDIVTLTPATSGGTFSGSGISGADFDPSAVGSTGTITITYNVTDGNGCSNSSNQNTDILATPDPSFGTLDPEYCEDEVVVTLVPATSGGTFTGPGMTGFDFDPTSANTGVNTIVYHVTGGNGCSDTSFQNVTVNPLPDATFTSLDPEYCSNDDIVVLTPNQAGGAFIGAGISNGNEFHPNIPSVGSTSVQYVITDANSCSNSSTQNVDILALPDLNINYNLLVLSSDESSMGATYQWVDCDNNYAPVSGATSQTFTVSQNGSYACIVSNGNCSDTTSCINVNDVSVQDYQDSKGIKVYPNPTNGMFNLVLDDQAFVTIYSSIGQMIYQREFNKGINVIQSLNDVSTGMYMIQVKYNDGSIETEKIIVEH